MILISISVTSRYWAIVPAAGTGSRMGASIPKQYLPLNGQPLVTYSVNALLASEHIQSVVVAIAPQDTWWASCDIADPSRVTVVPGGNTRAESVYQALLALQSTAKEDDWVLVHDAARPYLPLSLLNRLMNALQDERCGGLLAIPVTDTLKRADEQVRVMETVSREALWRAQTPQMFRYSVLMKAMQSVWEYQGQVTDEASAVESMGGQPRLIMGDARNFKVTYPDDIDRMAVLLASEESE